jgi:hypothetical protein
LFSACSDGANASLGDAAAIGGSLATGGSTGQASSTGAGGGTAVSTRTGAGGSAGTSTSSGSFLDAWTQAYCAWLSRCRLVPGPELCQRALATPVDLVTLQDDIAAGRVLYDKPRADSCFAAMASRPCLNSRNSDSSMQQDCSPMLKGTLSDGENCYSGAECTSGICFAMPCNAGCCRGTCRSRNASGEGAGCRSSSDCAGDLYCESLAASPVCKTRTGLGSACTDWNQCTDGLACDGSSGGKTCRPYPADGEACDNGASECDSSSSYCDAMTKRCTPRLPTGSACKPATDVNPAGSQCELSSLCIGGICRAFVGPGDACDNGPTSSLGRCLGGTCESGTCSAAPPLRSCWK